MKNAIIVLHDRTNHGGTVISALFNTNTHGKPWARRGDMVACPRCRGVFPIAEGDNSFIVEGQPVAFDGCRVTCGAVLIASQMFSTTDPSGGAGGGAAQGSSDPDPVHARLAAQGLGDIGGGMAAGYADVPLDDSRQRFKGRFLLRHIDTDEPVVGQAVRLRSTHGQYLTGTTDAQGHTPWVEHDADETLAVDLTDAQP